MHVNTCTIFTYVHLHAQCPWRSEESVGFPRVMDGCGSPNMEVLETNSGPLASALNY